MRNLIPHFIADKFNSGVYSGSFNAAVFFVDVANFSGMSDRLAVKGKIGAEIISEALNSVFSPAIRSVHKFGGFVTHFSGDAFTAVFPEENGNIKRASSCALLASIEIIRDFKNTTGLKTESGSFELSAKIGVSYGRIYWRIISNHLQNAYYFSGVPLNSISECEQRCSPGDIVFDGTLLKIFSSDECAFDVIEPDYFSLITFRSSMIFSDHKFIPPVNSPEKLFYPESVSDQSQTGEFRKFISCFIYFQAFDHCNEKDVDAFKQFYDSVIKSVKINGGFFNRISFGDKGSFMLVFFGMPFSTDRLFQNACRFVLEIKELRKDIRIGMSCGTGYAGLIGSSERYEFTGISRKVNLAARLMSAAGKDEILTDDDIYFSARSDFSFAFCGSKKVKGFDMPVDVYRLNYAGSAIEIDNFFFGRTDQLKYFRLSYHNALKRKIPFHLIITGNTGSGKTLLAEVFVKKINAQKSIFLSCRQSQRSYGLILDLIGIILQLRPGIRNDLRKHDFTKSYNDFCEKSSYKNELLKLISVVEGFLEVEQKPNSTFSKMNMEEKNESLMYSVFYMLMTEISKGKLCLLLDDYHYIDRLSSDIINKLFRIIKDRHLTVFYCIRNTDNNELSLPESADDRIDLEGLKHADSEKWIKKTVFRRSGNISASIKKMIRLIYERTEGNPLYIRTVIDYLVSLNTSSIEAVELNDIIINNFPADIESALLKNFDILPIKVKNTIKRSAVIGNEFPLCVLTGMTNERNYRKLISEIFMNYHILQDIGGSRVRFFEGSFRNVLYGTILSKDLHNFHSEAAEAVIRKLRPTGKNLSEAAFHYRNAGKYTQAYKYYMKAGDIYLRKQLYSSSALQFEAASSMAVKENSDNFRIQFENSAAQAALLYMESGIYDKADELYNGILNFYGTVYSVNGEILKDFALVKIRSGDFKNALELLNKCENTLSSDLCDSSLLLKANIEHYRGIVYGKKGYFNKQSECLRSALKIRLSILGENNRQTAESYNALGYMHGDMGEYKEQLECYKKVLNIFRLILGRKHPKSAMMYNSIGFCLGQTGKYKMQLKYYKSSLNLRTKLFGDRHPETATAFNSLGYCLLRLERHDEALKAVEKSLEIRLELLTKDNPSLGTSYLNLADVYSETGEDVKAEKYLKKAQTIFRKKLLPDHPLMKTCKRIEDRIKEIKG